MTAVVAGLILYGMVDDSPLLAAMDQSLVFAASWKMIQAGCLLAVSAMAIAGFPLAWSIVLYAVRERKRSVYLRLAAPFVSALALVAWMAAVLIGTGGHWAASPWAVAFSRPDWPSESVRRITGSVSAALLVLGCFASAASISQLVRGSQLPDFRIAYPEIKVQMNSLSFAAALVPWAAAGMFIMLAGVLIWGYSALHLSAMVLRSTSGPLGLSGLASWILSTIGFGFAAAIAAQAACRSQRLNADH